MPTVQQPEPHPNPKWFFNTICTRAKHTTDHAQADNTSLPHFFSMLVFFSLFEHCTETGESTLANGLPMRATPQFEYLNPVAFQGHRARRDRRGRNQAILTYTSRYVLHILLGSVLIKEPMICTAWEVSEWVIPIMSASFFCLFRGQSEEFTPLWSQQRVNAMMF